MNKIGLILCALCGFMFCSSAKSINATSSNNVLTTTAKRSANDEDVYYKITTNNATGHGNVTYTGDKVKIENDTILAASGSEVTIVAKASVFYKINAVTNESGIEIKASETLSGVYTFTMPNKDLTIKYEFATDSEVIEEFNKAWSNIKAGNWSEIFSVSNVLTIVTTLLNSGILIAMIRYVVMDKRIATKLENTVKEEMDKILPETSKAIILESFEKVLTPIFNNILAQTANIQASQASLVKVASLMTENTPEAKLAILEELSKLQISDSSSIDEIKAYITQQTKALEEQLAAALAKLDEIEQSNAEKVSESEAKVEESEEEPTETTTTPVE